jgi:hypothetical protein
MAVSADPNLGPVLLEQKPNRGNLGNGCFLVLLALPMMGSLAVPAAPLALRLGLFGLGLCLGGFALVMLWRNWVHVFLQERGVREYRHGKGRSLAYDQVDELQYSALRLFHGGAYIHTVQKLALRSERSPGPPLVCTLILKEADGRAPTEARTALTRVRDAVALLLAERLLQRILRDEAIAWTPGVRISRHGLEIDQGSALELVEWRQVHKLDAGQGTLRLWTQGGTAPRVQMSMAQPDFYPAYVAAVKLIERSRAG